MIEKMNFDKEGGLIPAIIQDAISGQVLMLAYMNQEALAKTLETGKTWFYSRSRQELWMKGESSGHVQTVKEILFDCDQDSLLIKVELIMGISRLRQVSIKWILSGKESMASIR
jgi:phosphoribosyl-AMP cyclohydrolase